MEKGENEQQGSPSNTRETSHEEAPAHPPPLAPAAPATPLREDMLQNAVAFLTHPKVSVQHVCACTNALLGSNVKHTD